MQTKKLIPALLILLIFYSCAKQDKINQLLEITSRVDQSTGFVDLTLSITDKKETDSSFIYTAEGLYKIDTVGVQIALKKGLTAGIVNGETKNVFVRKGISIKSIGAKSDKLLSAMTELYKVDSVNNKMRSDLLILTCANLNEEDINYSYGEYKFKAFMETEEEYGELFIDFDFTNNLILLNEKDPDYRKGVLNYLMKK